MYSGKHGLEGNVVALDEGDGLAAVSAGPPDFRDRFYKARGGTLMVPTLAQRFREHGGSIVFSNVSAGAAQFQEPRQKAYDRRRHDRGSCSEAPHPMETPR